MGGGVMTEKEKLDNMYGKGLAGSDVFKPLRAHDYQTQSGTAGQGTVAHSPKGRFMFGCPECGATSTHTPSCLRAYAPLIRTFDTGATRDTAEGKLEFRGFLHPLVLERYAAYMNKNRVMKDGSKRASDNWQKGIPKAACMDSAWRHFQVWWKRHEGVEVPGPEGQIEEDICALIFNAMSYLHTVLKERKYTGEESQAEPSV